MRTDDPSTSARAPQTRQPQVGVPEELGSAHNWRAFREAGLSVAAWARERGFGVSLVYAVLSGKRKCLRGQSHAIAVALGRKPPAVTD